MYTFYKCLFLYVYEMRNGITNPPENQKEPVTTRLTPKQLHWLKQQAEEENTSRSKVLRDLVRAQVKEPTVTIPLFPEEREYVYELAQDIGVNVETVVHYSLLLFKRLEEGFEEIFMPRKKTFREFISNAPKQQEGILRVGEDIE